MHWVLDANFREDDSGTRERMLGNNLSWLRRFAITRLKPHPLNESLRGKMQVAGRNDDFLAEVLTRQYVGYALDVFSSDSIENRKVIIRPCPLNSVPICRSIIPLSNMIGTPNTLSKSMMTP